MAIVLSTLVTRFPIWKDIGIFCTIDIKILADKEETMGPAEAKKLVNIIKLVKTKRLVDVEKLANIKKLVVIYYKHQY